MVLGWRVVELCSGTLLVVRITMSIFFLVFLGEGGVFLVLASGEVFWPEQGLDGYWMAERTGRCWAITLRELHEQRSV